MALWPFRRKSRRKRPRGGGPASDHSNPDVVVRDPPADPDRTRSQTTTPPPATQAMPVKRQPNKLHRRARSLSFEKGREDALAIERRRTSRKRTSGAVAQGPVDPRAHPYTRGPGAPIAAAPDISPFEQDTFPRIPTLYLRTRNAQQPPRKMSTKRRKADHAREAEIRALSAMEPSRSPGDLWDSARPVKKDTKKGRPGFGLSLRRSWEKDQQNSNASLPLAGSIHSSFSSDSEHVSFKVSAFEALVPRPTLRYSVEPRYSPLSAGRPARHVSVRNKVADKQPIPEATLKAHKRIDDLADDLTASDLRQLMERDSRRRAKKRQQDQERMEERLARRAEIEGAAQREGRASPPNLERGVLGRESVGLGIGPESAVITSSTPRTSPRSSPGPTAKQLGKRPAAEMEDAEDVDEQAGQGPLEHFHRTDSIPLDGASITSVPEELPIRRDSSPRKKIILMPRASKSKSRSPPPVSQPAESSKPEGASSIRKLSGGSLKRMQRSWSNLFRWSSRSKRRSGPSSFSNTSRDSMSGAQLPGVRTPIGAGPMSPAVSRKISSGMPKRTLSRFREDLPELPLSPPQSRDVSPEPAYSAIMEMDSPELESTEMARDETVVLPKRRDTPMSPDEAMSSVPASIPTTIAPSPEPVTVSLASVDSEGSWFGKRPSNRRSIPTPLTPPRIQHPRPVSSSTFDSHHDPDLPRQEFSEDVSDIANDEYLSRLTNTHNSDSHMTNARPSSDASGGARWGVVGGRQPNVVELHAGNHLKSHEGLLHAFSDDGGESEAEANDEDADHTITGVREQRQGLQPHTAGYQAH